MKFCSTLFLEICETVSLQESILLSKTEKQEYPVHMSTVKNLSKTEEQEYRYV